MSTFEHFSKVQMFEGEHLSMNICKGSRDW